MAKLSRFEVNKKVKQIMSRCGVDMTQLQISAMGNIVNLNGILIKIDGGDLSVQEIELMSNQIRGLTGVSDITCNLDNWSISHSSIAKISGAKGHTPRAVQNDEE